MLDSFIWALLQRQHMNLNMKRLLQISRPIALIVIMASCASGGGSNSASSSSSTSSSSSSTTSSASSGSITGINSQWPVAFVLPYDDGSESITHFGSRLNH